MDAKQRIMRPALWTGMFSQYMSIEDTVKELVAAGFCVAELCEPYLNKLAKDPQQEKRTADLRKFCDQLSFAFTQAHGLSLGYSHIDKTMRIAACHELEATFPVLQMLGIHTMAVHPGTENNIPVEVGVNCLPWRRRWERCLDANIASFRRLVRNADLFGIRIAIENKIDGDIPGRRMFSAHPMDIEALLDKVPGLGLNLDFAHANAMNLDIPFLIRQFGDRLCGLHVSDNNGDFFDLHLIPGKGKLNWPAVIQALREVGYTGDFHLELPHERSKFLKKTRQAARKAFVVTKKLLEVL